MRLFLFPLYWLYQKGSWIKNYLYKIALLKTARAPLFTVSVGNISFGGSHKTPLARHLLSFLAKKGMRPALISRGYRGRWEKKGGVLSDGISLLGSWTDSGDEPFMIARAMPETGVYIGKNRLLSCQRAKTMGFDAAILDDGFQNRRLKKDIEIVLVDPQEKIALRESWSSLQRADILLVRKDITPAQRKKLQTKAHSAKIFSYSIFNRGIFDVNGGGPFPTEEFKGRKVLAISGIASPQRFHLTLNDSGIFPQSILAFPDHFPYPSSSIKKILDVQKKQKSEVFFTTEKDVFKLDGIQKLNHIPLYYLKIDLNIEEEFYGQILRLFEERRG